MNSTTVEPAFLEDPRVAVRVREISEAGIVATFGIHARVPRTGPRFEWVLMTDPTDRDALSDQPRPRLSEVGRYQVQVMNP